MNTEGILQLFLTQNLLYFKSSFLLDKKYQDYKKRIREIEEVNKRN